MQQVQGGGRILRPLAPGRKYHTEEMYYDTGTNEHVKSVMLSNRHSYTQHTVANLGKVRGVQMHPPFEGLLLRVLSKSAQT